MSGEGTVDVCLGVLQLLQSHGLNAHAQLPQDEQTPVVRVEENGGAPASSQGPNRMTRQDLNIDVWGATKAQAQTVLAQARDLLLAAPRVEAVQDACVLIDVRANPPQWLPDPDWIIDGRPAPRYLLIATVSAHPAPTS